MSLLYPEILHLAPKYRQLESFVRSLPERFDRGEGRVIHKSRNELRVISYEGQAYVVKSYRRPMFVNRLVYGFLRASKAKRAFDNASLLLRLGIGTPEPVAYLNIRSAAGLLFDRSFFVSVASTCPYRYEDLFKEDIPFADDVLRAIGHLTAKLHNAGLAHKDYGRANILFDKTERLGLRLELVDLNRMAHGPLDIKAGCKNFERLPATPHMHRLMAETYAADRGFDPEECFRLMQAYRSTQPGKIDDKY